MSAWPWYLSRAAGLVAWFLLTVGVVDGLLLSMKRLRKPSVAWHTDLHRMFAACGVMLVGVHVTSLLFDQYVTFTPTEMLVPGAAHWRPVAIAFGVVAMYLLVAVELTSLARNSLPARVWHGTHLLALAVFVGGSVHAYMAGADTRAPLALATCFGAFVAVGLLVGARFSRDLAPRRNVVAAPPRGDFQNF
ncbi:MAG: hypothetical protein ACOYNI_02495 [Acidimicrobiia bacterium]